MHLQQDGIADPNGMVYADGFYHLYYQWNPYAVWRGNMQWGHVKSRSLSLGTGKDWLCTGWKQNCFTRLWYQDKDNRQAMAEGTLLYFYTAAGSEKSVVCGCRKSVYPETGVFLQMEEKLFRGVRKNSMPHIVSKDKDPKVFIIKAKHLLVLYLDGYDFAVYRSTDLLNWEKLREFQNLECGSVRDLLELEDSPQGKRDGNILVRRWL